MDADDWRIRSAALGAVTRLAEACDWEVPWARIAEGFRVDDRRIRFASKALGIFRPAGMGAALSVKTTVPRGGRPKLYRDQNPGGLVTHTSTGLLAYDLQAKGRSAATRNEWLLRAMERRLPLIYFHGVREGVYQPIAPVWVVDHDAAQGCVALATGDVAGIRSTVRVTDGMGSAYSRGFHLRRNDQSRFSTLVREAYGWQCALSGLSVPELLVGARIAPHFSDTPDTARNGISMSVLHRGAFNANLVGIDPDYRIHVSRQAAPVLGDLGGGRILLPEDPGDWPSRERLAERFESFLGAQG